MYNKTLLSLDFQQQASDTSQMRGWKDPGETSFVLASFSGNEVAFPGIPVNEPFGGNSLDSMVLLRNNFGFWASDVPQWTRLRPTSAAIPEMAGTPVVPFELPDYCRQQHNSHITISFDLPLVLQRWIISLGSLMLFLICEVHRNKSSIHAIDLEKCFDSFQWDYFFQLLGTLKSWVSLLWGRQLLHLHSSFKVWSAKLKRP